jgi:Uma2 family endonuclease
VWAAFESVPDHLVAEIVDGELHTQPRPRLRHASAATRITGRLRPFFDPNDEEPGGWIILIEPELHLGEMPDVIVPDLAGWRRERLPQLPDDAACTLAPDWICEVLSPSTERLDRTRKMRIYRREGVSYLWLLSPEIQTLEVHRLERGHYVILENYEGHDEVRAEPFETIEIDLEALWST